MYVNTDYQAKNKLPPKINETTSFVYIIHIIIKSSYIYISFISSMELNW